MLLGQEHHPHPVLARRRQLDAVRRQLVAEQLVRHLQQDARTVAEQLVGAGRSAMIQVQQDPQTVLDDVMALDALLIWATKPTPQASFSCDGSYSPCATGSAMLLSWSADLPA